MKHAIKAGVLTAVLLLFSSWVVALNKVSFSEEKFKKLQSENAVVLVDVYATWCPTCQKQQILFERFQSEHPEHKLHVLVIDYDKDKALVKKYNAPRQSTLVLFKGEKQLWHSVAETNYDVIERELMKAFKL